ncbi:DUF2510 domain-containing protein [Mycolicibacterium sp. S3B2]|uniref:DUF2510 domain-containing protein n=1 Tax=Mycolicibacterium sp. S3B2 TaxID=3415120 RepID=UPI003C7A298F
MPGDAPPGWYPDPSGSGSPRWWDGQQWTLHFRSTSPRPDASATARIPLGGTERIAVFVVLALLTVGIGLAGVHVLRGRDEGDSFQQGYELGRRVVHFVEDGTSPQTACETMVWADQIGRGARYSRAEVRERTAGCLEAVSDLTER